MEFFYNYIFIPIISFFIWIIKKFNEKLNERELLSIKNLENFIINKNTHRIWFHAASMGEFEQAKPVIEFLKKIHPEFQIICSFFSPSGYRNQKNYKYADFITYLPLDTKKNSRLFLEKIKPDVAVFIRYEIWYNYIKELNLKSIPIFLICATKPRSELLNKFFRVYNHICYSLFSEIITVGETHTEFFKNLKIKTEIQTLYDTRFDRISEAVELALKNPILPKEIFQTENTSEYLILVAGSTWQPDEEILVEAIEKFNLKSDIKIKLILVPHEPDEKNLSRLKKLIPESVLLSNILIKLENQDIKVIQNIQEYIKNKIIIVDSIGKLLKLYSLADIAYIGGAFGVGVHSVAEAAGYGLPLATGAKMTNSPDAVNLNQIGVLRIIHNSEDLTDWFSKIINNKTETENIKDKAQSYIFNSVGSSKFIANKIINSMKK